MQEIKDNLYYTKRILRSEEVLRRYLNDKTLDDLMNDGFLRDAMENRFTKMAEDAAHLTKDYKEKNSDIPWGAITKIRNTVCHDYDVVDATILYKTIKHDFFEFRKILLNNLCVHNMYLHHKPFVLIESRKKTIEMRLFDEKRKALKLGDLIVFTDLETKNELIVEATDLKAFNSFDDLYARYKKTDLGYGKDDVANPDDMLIYYSKDEINQYGVLAIEIKLY